LLDGVEEDTPISIATDELPGARHERDDLWRSVDAVRRDGRLCAEPKMAAYCEVQLAWAGYEATTGGWRHVDPYVRIAEDYCVAAIEAAPLPYTARMVRNEPRVIEPVPRLLDFDLPAIEVAATLEDMPAVQADAFALFVLFPHNRSRPGDIRPPGRRELAQLARQLSALPAQTGVSVVGHADITGHVKYNAALSARRARSVALELAKRGVDPTRIRIGAAGSARPVVKCPTAAKHSGKSHYLQCLEPNRRVVVELIGAE
jgi:outer membrane protein OmpA-like peptidoglycan-associated protein